MEKSIFRFTKIGCAVVLGMVISYCQLARAGWSVKVNASTGKGTLTVKVTSRNTVTNTTSVTSLFLTSPSATINQQSNNLFFSAKGALPATGRSFR